ncbi:MAG: hypothetical protein ACTHK4_08685 [Mycobacteriales bacterium]
MDAYVLGKLSGDLPTEILGKQGQGSVRAMGRLEGSHHEVFVAVEAETKEGIDDALAAVAKTGIASEVTFRPDPDAAASVPLVVHLPARVPPWLRLIFIWLEQELNLKALEEAVHKLGKDGVAAVSHGGRALIELGHDEAEKAEAAAKAVAAAHPGAVVARVDPGGLAYTAKHA